ncbi:NADPH-dependent FMN reductase [Paenibacillus sp. GCM10012307]|uniref:NAD(P)H-dependent oxidoreductase n=1 Tax=Paenibacillus roseus TaxID=2798579 RepID=A0A934IV08_9BACL|nr:NADPH-dependent FMN reductase [Paenibacillus roseus]MBJ6359837.1 NAD(P)H-dependent oxidoreductase [Paenibacillus roseus]
MKIAILAGGNRQQATSTLLARYVKKVVEQRSYEVDLIDLHKEPLPFYSPDNGDVPPAVQRLQSTVKGADAVVLSTPEYHGSLSGVLKNALDFLNFEHFDGKLVLVCSSAGGSVGTSSLTQLQTIVRNLHGINSPEWISIGGQQRNFGEDGEPGTEEVKARIQRTVDFFLALAAKVRQH